MVFPVLAVIIGLIILIPILILIVGKKYALGMGGLLIGYFFLSGGLTSAFTRSKIVDCLTSFSTCSNSQIFGLLIIIASFAFMFIPSSKFK